MHIVSPVITVHYFSKLLKSRSIATYPRDLHLCLVDQKDGDQHHTGKNKNVIIWQD